MKKVKLIKRFFKDRREAKARLSVCKKQAVAPGQKVFKAEVVDAYELFRKNGWLKAHPFKSLGRPQEGYYIIVLHLDAPDPKPEKPKTCKTNRKRKTANTGLIKLPVLGKSQPSKIIRLRPMVRKSARVIKLRPTARKTVKPFAVVNYRKVGSSTGKIISKVVSIVMPVRARGQVIDISLVPQLTAA